MASVTDPKCPNCHADLPLDAPTGVLTCKYCGNQVKLDAPAVSPVQVRAVVLQASQAPKIKPMIFIIPVLLLVMGAGVAVFFAASKGQQSSAEAVARAEERTAKVRAKAEKRLAKARGKSGERLLWLDSAMHIARVNDDAIDDLLILGRFYGDSDSRVHLVAIDGATGKRIWKSVDFGSVGTSNAHTRTITAVQGDNIVVTDHRASARILELASGRELRSITLTDVGKAMCPVRSDPGKVWIEVADGNHVNLTLADAKISASKKRPAGCPDRRSAHAGGCREHAGSATCSSERIAPSDGMRIDTVLSADDQRVGLGRKYPGTAVPMVAGLAGKKTTWSRLLVEDVNQEVKSGRTKLSDMAAGRLFVAYELAGDERRLVAIDARSGSNTWDVAIPTGGRRGPRLETLAASPSHVFIGADEHLFIFDAKTGKLIAGASAD